MLETTRKIVKALRKAEQHLLAAMSTKDRVERIRLENEAECCIELAKKLESELEPFGPLNLFGASQTYE